MRKRLVALGGIRDENEETAFVPSPHRVVVSLPAEAPAAH